MHELVAILLLLGAVFAIEASESDKEISERCMHELGLTTESYGSHVVNGTRYSDDVIKCVDACLLKAHGIMKEDGTFEVDTVMKLISDYSDDDNVKRKIVESCTSKKAENDCDTAHDMMICMHELMMQDDENN